MPFPVIDCECLMVWSDVNARGRKRKERSIQIGRGTKDGNDKSRGCIMRSSFVSNFCQLANNIPVFWKKSRYRRAWPILSARREWQIQHQPWARRASSLYQCRRNTTQIISSSRMGDISYRIALTMLNIFFPPLAVALLCGFGADLLVNCLWFLLAIFPSHIHGFWVSCTYFHRRRKVTTSLCFEWTGTDRNCRYGKGGTLAVSSP